MPQPSQQVSDGLKARRNGLYDMLWPLLQAANQLRTAGAKRARNASTAHRPTLSPSQRSSAAFSCVASGIAPSCFSKLFLFWGG